MDGIIKQAVKAFEIPEIATLAMLMFVVALKLAKKYFDSRIEERTSRIRYVVEELKTLNMANAYLVEQVFSERYKILLNFKEIKYFLRTSRPSLNLYLFQKSANYFCFNNTGSRLFLHSNTTPKILRIKGFIFGIGYYLFAILAMSFLQALPDLHISNLKGFISFYFVGVALLFVTFMCVHAQMKTEYARRLIISIQCDNS